MSTIETLTSSDKIVQTLLNVATAAASVAAVTYLTKRRERPVEAVFDAGMDYQRRLTDRKAVTA